VGPMSLPKMYSRLNALLLCRSTKAREESHRGFSGKTARYHSSGAWSRHLANKAQRAENNRKGKVNAKA
jgi:hypothetical protein